VRRLLVVLVAIAFVGSAFAQPAPTPDPAPTDPNAGSGAPPAPPALNLQSRAIERVQFRGNRKVEDDAIRVQLLSKPGTLLDAAKLREDLRTMWKMGFFADIDVEAEVATSGGVVLTFAVKEKPSIRKVLVAGHSELGLDKINEVIDLELDAIVDISKVKKNREKISDLYVQKGFYLATVDYEIKPVNESEVDVYFKVDEKAKVKIREVQFIGNNQIPDDELRTAVATRRADSLSFLNDSGTYSQEAFERDLLLVSAYYWDRGFANVKVGTPNLRLSRDKQYMYLSIPIDEGPVFTIGEIKFKGDLIGSKEKNLEKIRIRSGMKFSRTRIAEDREKISNYYQDQGYAYANVLPLTKVDLPNRKINLTFEIARGKRAYFERINIRGNSKTRDKVIRREMKISEGELFNNTNLEISKRRINALGFFENVVVEQQARLVGRVRRGQRRGVRAAHRHVPDRRRLLVGRKLHRPGADQRRTTCSGAARPSRCRRSCRALRQLFLLRFVEPYFLDTRWTFAFDLYNQSRGFGTFSRNASGGTLTWGYPLSYEARAFFTYKLEDVDISTGSGGIANLGAPRSADRGDERREPVPRRRDLVAARLAVLGLAQQPPVPVGRLVPHVVRRVREPVHRLREQVRALGWLRAPLPPAVGAVRLSRQHRARLHHLDRSARRSDQRALPRRWHLRHPWLRAAYPRPVAADAAPRRRRQSLGSLPLGGNMQLIVNSEVEFPLFKKVGISGVVFFDMGNAYNLEDRYCSGLSAQERDDRRSSSTRASGCRTRWSRASASRWASASAGSRRSARSASSGAFRSTPSVVKTRWCSSSRSETSCENSQARVTPGACWRRGGLPRLKLPL
jgi:outer membrane protein insertion porin family